MSFNIKRHIDTRVFFRWLHWEFALVQEILNPTKSSKNFEIFLPWVSTNSLFQSVKNNLPQKRKQVNNFATLTMYGHCCYFSAVVSARGCSSLGRRLKSVYRQSHVTRSFIVQLVKGMDCCTYLSVRIWVTPHQWGRTNIGLAHRQRSPQGKSPWLSTG